MSDKQTTCNFGDAASNISNSPSGRHEDFIDQDMWEPHGDPATQSNQSNISMASNDDDQMSTSEQPPTDFKTKFHPHSSHPLLFQSQEEFGLHAVPMMACNTQPWHPFIEEGDYIFAKIPLQVGLSTPHINGLLMLISHIGQGKAMVTL
ncbi:hypothetical protein EDC04DRAFT_2922002 [Pisolithus marmoratus]|nr:hypothetical protein EDC04DRAFT_2922002 [Pisolithus marmoratus]